MNTNNTNTKKINRVAVVGATGLVGQEMLFTLHQRKFPADEVIALASAKSAGTKVKYGDGTLTVQSLEDFDFTGTQIALFSAGATVSDIYGKKAAKANCIVIDNSSFYRTDPEIPLVIPEVNPEAISQYVNHNIIANPNCSTIQMLVALKPLHQACHIKRIVVSSYQAVSGGGKDCVEELQNQVKA
jgi:aspartate-semialdehyde dehydrogenase